MTNDDVIFETLRGRTGNARLLFSEYKTFGASVNKLLGEITDGYFVALVDDCGYVRPRACDYIKGYVLNPGTILVKNAQYDMDDVLGNGIMAIFSGKARALKKASWPVVRETKNLKQFTELWEKNKILALSKEVFTDYEYKIEKNKKYAMYGIGTMAEELYHLFEEEQVIAIADSDENKWGKYFHGLKILSPEELYAQREEYDKVFVSSRKYFSISKTGLLEIGFDWDDIVTTLMVL